MIKVKNTGYHDVVVVAKIDSYTRQTFTVKRGGVAQIPLCSALKSMVAAEQLVLVDGGEIVDIPGGMRHKKPSPLPPLRSVDEDWLA